MIFQEPMTSLNPVLTIGRQLTEGLIEHKRMSQREADARAVEMLKLVRLPEPAARLRQYPHQLSGGMRQRAMIAMAMAGNPAILIADEPTTALDVTVQAQILDLMRDLQRETGTAIILITHDLGVVAEMCDRVAVMYAGEIVEQTDVRSLFARPRHPYTQGLIGSVPTLGQAKAELETIPGTVPNLIDLPPACRFAPRCAARVERSVPYCEEIHPALRPLDDEPAGHDVRCWIYHRPTGRA
jgi:oligopeptide/dipeptide ABC transporter ATP-binding protein